MEKLDSVELSNQKIAAEIANMFSEIHKRDIEITKLISETAKIKRETAWYPAIAMAGTIAATAALVKIFF